MWLMTNIGAYSIVRKGARGEYQIRAREKRDIQNLLLQAGLPADRLIVTKWGDYAFRIIANREEIRQIFAFFADTIDYGNFKSEVARHAAQSNKVSVYHEIWRLLSRLQPWPPYSGGKVSDPLVSKAKFSANPNQDIKNRTTDKGSEESPDEQQPAKRRERKPASPEV